MLGNGSRLRIGGDENEAEGKNPPRIFEIGPKIVRKLLLCSQLVEKGFFDIVNKQIQSIV
jgi:hypothetical protein